LAIIILPTITGVCTPACLLAASISVEAVTPPLVGLALERSTSSLGGNPGEVKHLIRSVSARGGRRTGRQSWVVSRRQNPILKRRWNGREPPGRLPSRAKRF